MNTFQNPHRLYFGNCPFDKTEEEVKVFFSDCGLVQDLYIVRDKVTNRSQGYGFITFTDGDAVPLAMAKAGSEFGGRRIKVNHASRNQNPGEVRHFGTSPRPTYGQQQQSYMGGMGQGQTSQATETNRLFIKNIPQGISEDQVKEHFAQYGNVSTFFFIRDHQTSEPRGFGFLDYHNAVEAQAALAADGTQAFGAVISVKMARPKVPKHLQQQQQPQQQGGYSQQYTPYNQPTTQSWGYTQGINYAGQRWGQQQETTQSTYGGAAYAQQYGAQATYQQPVQPQEQSTYTEASTYQPGQTSAGYGQSPTTGTTTTGQTQSYQVSGQPQTYTQTQQSTQFGQQFEYGQTQTPQTPSTSQTTTPQQYTQGQGQGAQSYAQQGQQNYYAQQQQQQQ